MKNVVVIGGTGMLEGATRWIMRHAEHTLIIGRSQRRLDRLHEADGSERATFVPLDYRSSVALRACLQDAVRTHGPIDVVVSWIHSTAPDAIAILAEVVGRPATAWRFIHVKGSANDLTAIRTAAPMPRECIYRQVMLGYQRSVGRSRWLTDQEVSDGVIQAIVQDSDVTVGQLEPWSARP